jgi:mannose-6-phosphate isomerase-like protein (cupin superfamily)
MTENPPDWTGRTTRTWLLRGAADTNGGLFEQRVEYAPGSPFPPSHHHPARAELFEIEQGAMVYVVDGAERRVEAGETLELPAGVVHKARNASTTAPAVIRWETRPALRSEAFLRTAADMGASGPLERALLAHEYRDVFRATGLLGWRPRSSPESRLLGRSLPDVDS